MSSHLHSLLCWVELLTLSPSWLTLPFLPHFCPFQAAPAQLTLAISSGHGPFSNVLPAPPSHFPAAGTGPYLLSLVLLDETGDLFLLLCFQLPHKEEQLPPLGTAQCLCSLRQPLPQVRQGVQPPQGLAQEWLWNCRRAEQGGALSALTIPPSSAAHSAFPKERAHAGQKRSPLYHSLLGEREVTGGQWESWNMLEGDQQAAHLLSVCGFVSGCSPSPGPQAPFAPKGQ